jgi:uncharacterized protein (TIGR02246 family)
MMNSDHEEITHIIHRQQDSWNRGDAAGYAVDCDEQISFTNIIGKMFFGREAFEERHIFLFTNIFKGSTLDMKIQRIHLPVPDIAIVDIACNLGGYQCLPEGVASQADGRLHTCLLEVLVRSEYGWRVIAYHNVDVKL